MQKSWHFSAVTKTDIFICHFSPQLLTQILSHSVAKCFTTLITVPKRCSFLRCVIAFSVSVLPKTLNESLLRHLSPVMIFFFRIISSIQQFGIFWVHKLCLASHSNRAFANYEPNGVLFEPWTAPEIPYDNVVCNKWVLHTSMWVWLCRCAPYAI